ncbi:MAG: putative RDD family membrane protein YckC [Gammaproteobacteria bacterium]|jgi:uncharacterized RDD family membrane protein YckC
MDNRQYAGFWIRVGASLIDTLLVALIILPALTAIYGVQYWHSDAFVQGTWDVLLNYILPIVAVIIFWIYKSATPGKMLTKLIIVDARTGQKPSAGQFVGRYFCYYVSLLPLFLGFIWIAVDKRKQGWHDKLAGTVVIKSRSDSALSEDSSTRNQ